MKVCYGTTRTVLLVGRWAIKTPAMVEWRLFLCGLLANMQERQFSRCGWAELCPVLFGMLGGWLIVMKRARPLTMDEFEAFDVEAFANGSDYCVPVEHKLDSFGVLDGRIVAVDYGQ